MRYNQGPPNLSLPPLPPLVRNILIGAFGLYVVELLFGTFLSPNLPSQLAWHRIGQGFDWYQPLTRYLVQGSQPLSFLLSLLVLYFFLPIVLSAFQGRQWLAILGSVFAGSLALGLLTDLFGILKAPTAAWGWTTLSTSCVALFGLARPKAVVNLFFILPVPAAIFAWGTGVVALLFFLFSPSLSTSQHLGSWCGLIAWWFLVGPGSRTRKLKAKARKIEKDLQRFKILDGGQSDDNRDDWVN